MVIKKFGNFNCWVDGNNNRWDTEMYSKEEAEKYSETLIAVIVVILGIVAVAVIAMLALIA